MIGEVTTRAAFSATISADANVANFSFGSSAGPSDAVAVSQNPEHVPQMT